MLDEFLSVGQVGGGVGRDFLRKNHYTKTCHNGPMCWGLFRMGCERLLGVVAFATPCSENVRSSVFGTGNKDRVTELHRVFVFDGLPYNTTTWFISRAISSLLSYRPQIRGLVSFSDKTEGHDGSIYRALNFMYCGDVQSSVFYRDSEGRLRHPRQNGVNVTKKMAEGLGWTPERRGRKRRWLLIIGKNRTDKRYWQNRCLWESVPYAELEVL